MKDDRDRRDEDRENGTNGDDRKGLDDTEMTWELPLMPGNSYGFPAPGPR